MGQGMGIGHKTYVCSPCTVCGWVCHTSLLRLCSLFQWTVPFCGWLCVAALMAAVGGLYFIPPRFLVLAWGENVTTHDNAMATVCVCPFVLINAVL